VNPTYDFAGQVAFVTGASSGMGLATARAFAEAGAAMTLADVDADALRAAERDLAAAGHRVLAVRCDVADEEQVAAAVATTVETFGSLDLAYNNAGIQSPMTDAADVFDRVNAVNLRGIWASMKHEPAQIRTQAPAPSSTARRSAASASTICAVRGRDDVSATRFGERWCGLFGVAALLAAPNGGVADGSDDRRLVSRQSSVTRQSLHSPGT
jgi:NAD(P)-dependent dehydrogenase (short-subunit alcohol dehydrogenase family)